MLYANNDPVSQRRQLRANLGSGRLLRFPGAFNAPSARMIERHGFDGIYVSGSVISASIGLPDIGLTTLSEVSQKAAEITKTSRLPSLVDADTGFGEVMNVARTIQTLEGVGITACHLEDQVNPKRCGHLDGKSVVETEEMIKRIHAAVHARQDPNFIVCARTDARAVEGIAAAIERAKAYVDAGADMVFPEALLDEHEFEQFRKAIDVPILANMTEFGKSKLLGRSILEQLGVNLVIYPVTLFRLAMGAVDEGLRALADSESQSELVSRMQTREQLYDVLDYEGYNAFDSTIFNFKLGN